jgi:hypothetical protein
MVSTGELMIQYEIECRGSFADPLERLRVRALAEASRKVITEQSRELERESLVSQVASGKPSERVDYSLTEYGKTLIPVLTRMTEWGVKHQCGRLRRRVALLLFTLGTRSIFASWFLHGTGKI